MNLKMKIDVEFNENTTQEQALQLIDEISFMSGLEIKPSTNQFEDIRDWARKRGIYASGDPKTQTCKLMEEAGELAKAVIHSNKDETIDAIGDCVVVLTNLAALCGLTIEDCIASTYAVISKRKGKMENGTFIKE